MLRLSGLLFVLLLAGSCSFDYEDARVEAREDTEVPQVEIHDVRMVVVRENRLELTAERIASYPDRGIQTFEIVTFKEFGPTGALRLSGSAESATLYLDTEHIELNGEVLVTSHTEGGSLSSDYLYWDETERLLRGAEDGTVRLERDDGSALQGSYFVADGRRNTVEFRRGVTGVFQSEDP